MILCIIKLESVLYSLAALSSFSSEKKNAAVMTSLLVRFVPAACQFNKVSLTVKQHRIISEKIYVLRTLSFNAGWRIIFIQIVIKFVFGKTSRYYVCKCKLYRFIQKGDNYKHCTRLCSSSPFLPHTLYLIIVGILCFKV